MGAGEFLLIAPPRQQRLCDGEDDMLVTERLTLDAACWFWYSRKASVNALADVCVTHQCTDVDRTHLGVRDVLAVEGTEAVECMQMPTRSLSL